MWLLIAVAIIAILFIISGLLKGNSRRNLQKQHVVVTGGSSGIGKAVAIEAARLGANVTIIARDVQKLEAAQREVVDSCIDKENQVIRYLSLDISGCDESMRSHIEKLENDLGPIYMLVNCAGYSACTKFEDISIKDVKSMMDVNFFGTYCVTSAVVPLMKKRRSGIVVLVGSQASLLGIFGYAAYSSTKFALRGLAESLHMEVCPYKMSVTLALPPDTDTPGFALEEQGKLEETRLVCNSAGLFKPDVVAKQLIQDALCGKFYSTVGFESFMMKTLCAGMTPFYSVGELIIQAMLMGIFRIIGQFYMYSFHNIVKNCAKLKDDSKKAE
ncbi:3-ketodihydrosphingosine reductase [Ischnura elegans]|uniref:3-ketodihydrosphingosine reductase n=1 Tax=Ischnura elegans TaxID=197161 RepID=UPI001ED8AAC3|nr:3-ketodihydrosphingosine reductase [Ischnura elegans]